MHDDELHRFKSDIHFLHYAADRYGYQRDRRESSVSSHVLRHPASGDKIVVRKDRDGHWTYFSVRDDRDHGTLIDFVQRRGRHVSLGSVREELRSWLGTPRPLPEALELPRRSPRVRSSGLSPRCSRRRVSLRPASTSRARGLRPETLSDPALCRHMAHRRARQRSVRTPRRDRRADRLRGQEPRLHRVRGGRHQERLAERSPRERPRARRHRERDRCAEPPPALLRAARDHALPQHGRAAQQGADRAARSDLCPAASDDHGGRGGRRRRGGPRARRPHP